MIINTSVSTKRILCPGHPWLRVTIGLVILLATKGVTWSQDVDPTDPVERAMYFVDRSTEATELFNTNDTEEALAIFQELDTGYADLDEDGYVALTIGDCLAVLERDEEAWEAYEAAAAAHPELETEIAEKITELELAGDNLHPDLLPELRSAYRNDPDSQFAAGWRLGRGLQKRAKVLLDEAATTFRALGEVSDGKFGPSRNSVRNHAAVLEELAEDLTLLVERTERRWGSARQPVLQNRCAQGQASPYVAITENQRCEREIRTKDGRRVKLLFETSGDAPSREMRVEADGKPVELTPTQRLLIRRHQERINTLLLEAVDAAQEPNAPEK